MKKLGFTLAEVIVALGIIGVIAAITVPMIGNIIPDKNKIQVLKIQKTIADINEMMLNDHSLYPGRDPNYPEDCVGFACTGLPFVEFTPTERWYYWGSNKYRTLLKRHLNVVEGAEVTSADFITADGVKWNVDFSLEDDYSAFITVDIDSSSDSVNCSYSSSCKNPDQFKFLVSKSGLVSPNDPLTWAYVRNMKINNKKADIEAASNCSHTFKTKTVNNPSITLW